MEKRKFSTKEKIALIILVVLMVAAVAVGAVLIIGNANKANEIISNTEHTTVDISEYTEPETETNADSTEKKAEKNTESKTSSKTSSKAASSSSSQSKNSSATPKSSSAKSTVSKTTSSKTGSDNSGGTKPKKIVPAANETHASSEVCKVNGKKCYVGDTITVAINLKTPVVLENYQGYTEFDAEHLEFIDVTMNSGGIYNEDDSVIYYNASILSGIDFTSEGTIYTAAFKVKKEGSTEIKNTIQVLTDKNDKAVKLSDCKESVVVYD